ncbi:MAG: HEAT repeat domain-containing protein [Treponema sp.]|jgi:HEAT repeat protein|nr:HEAT repeat domain-containing protein [Treponema sp.]
MKKSKPILTILRTAAGGTGLRPCLVFALVLFLTGSFLMAEETPAAEEPETAVSGEAAAPAADQVPSQEDQRLEIIRYGTDAEIAALIQSIKNENAGYLDEAFAELIETTKNRTILSGLFSYFGDRDKKNLEDRALAALENRDGEAGETILAAVDYLGKIRSVKALAPLKELLDAEEQRFMNAAIKALGRAAGSAGEDGTASAEADEAAEFLIDFYGNRDPGNENKREIITALGETGSPKGVSFLSGIAGNEDEGAVLRIAALQSLAKLADGGGLEAVLKAVSSADPNVRASAVAALGPFPAPEADAAIIEAFRDSFYRTRIAAAQAAGERKLAGAAAYLRYRAERDDVPAVKDEAIKALGAIWNGETRTALEVLFSERRNPDRVRILAAEMLIKYDPDAYTHTVIAGLDEAKSKNMNPLYNGILRVLGGARSQKIEDLAARFFSMGGVVEKSYALDMTANNDLTGLIEEVRKLTDEKNGSLSRKAKTVLEQLEGGARTVNPEQDPPEEMSPEA